MSVAPARMIERPRRHAGAAREACVVEVGAKSPPVLFHAGETFRLETLPPGSEVPLTAASVLVLREYLAPAADVDHSAAASVGIVLIDRWIDPGIRPVIKPSAS